ncbi:MAG: Yip1 family protein [Negativicutes bacterium]|nr:Yip1 family protein [Negativicutes bacterium]
MGKFLETLYDVLFHPYAAMRQIAANRLVGQALAAFLLSVLIPAFTVFFAFKAGNFVKFGILLQTLGSLFVWFVGAAVFSLIAELFGGRGSAVGLFAALGFTHVPWLVAVPLMVLAMLLPANASAVALAIIVLGIVCWMLLLDVAAIKGTHELSTAKAVLVVLTPLLIMTAMVLVLMVFAGSALIPGRIWQ